MQIQDGSGKGYWTKVDSYNRIHTYSTGLKEISDVSSRSENAYSITTDVITFNSTNEHPWLYMRNDSDLYLYISSVIYSYNGGDTNHDRVMIKRVYRDVPEPTDRYSNDCNQSNLNMGSNNTASLTTYSWDGSGDGMEIDLTDVKQLSTSLIMKGSLLLGNLEGIILPFNSSMLFTYEPEEVGTASISIKLYFNHIRS